MTNSRNAATPAAADASALIDARIAALDDWRGPTLARLRTLIHDPGMYYKEINDTLGGNVRVALPKGIALKGQGSFTRSVLRIPVNIPAAVQRQVAGEDHGDGIYQLGFGVEYHPEMFESFSAKLGYRTNQWSDKNDSRNNGRVNVVETSLSAKF